jgi:Ca2+-binding EF-hand superfamily protein
MRMALKTLLVGVLAMFLAGSANAQDEKKAERKRQGPTAEETFKKMDADGNGKVTKEEYTKYVNDNERLAKRAKDDPKWIDTTFERMDGDKDGKVTLDEYKKYRESMGARKKKTPPTE